MRRITAALLGCLVLAGCASSWQADLKFKVTEINDYQFSQDSPVEKKARLELVGSIPDDALSKENWDGFGVALAEVSGGEVKVGDELTCTARQEKDGPIQTGTMQTRLSGCKKA
ncbi:hypothetical protein C8D88_101411 [Lentzea atacamensis]|uniref:Lipoprotein n=1 Tax=Lentzea atacamensis TaxID=531938 RepID=A0A316IT97_9PSEU|nr:hypothetical protein [Lentzea atacamensis]PWK90395.1 hypothetical protein C8D88_101411 [Lentzea atacamensis]RAS68383.1 hypothetical protein C8D87_102448 [Lentzea atacamensis]